MDETVKQETNATENESTEQKTFTQAELDSILKDRLTRERAKYDGFEELKAKAAKYDELEEANKSELQKANDKAQALENELNSLKKASQIREIHDQVAEKTGVPAALLTAETLEECEAQADAILKFAQPGAYPYVKDGGEVRNTRTRTARDAFEEWAAKAL